ncbi:MAG: hypothetical protein OEY11_11110 [Gammaproteobacteria bacterium]|nr:hypothetical protein [Gammaproteobacteria bacterium]
MNINLRSVLFTGLIAGLVIIVSAATMVPFVGNAFDENLARFDLPPLGVGAMFYFTSVSLFLGIVVVSIYAAILPGLMSKFKAAIISSLLVWFLAYFLPNVSMVVYGFMPVKLTIIGTVWGLVEILLASMVGARFYKVKYA